MSMVGDSAALASPVATLTSSELIELAAIDTTLFQSEFFPYTVRQAPAEFHPQLDKVLESSARQVLLLVSRGFAKTTKLRMFAAKRIAYGLARTILYIAISEKKAIQSVSWLRGQIETNRKFTDIYRLGKGDKWTDIECSIRHEIMDHQATVLALGITGGIRGINIEDNRPDLIVLDDIIDDENAATPEQRQKIEELLYGAVIPSLAPPADVPDAKIVMLQTPLNKADVSIKNLEDPSWLTAKFNCWSGATKDLPDEYKESAWPERYTTADLLAKKKGYIARNQSSVWYREYELDMVDPETASFKSEWLQFYDIVPVDEMTIIGAIDPVPPPTDIQIAKGLHGKDYEAFAIIGSYQGKYYLLDYSLNKGHTPNWTISEFFRLSLKYNPKIWVIETVAYQKTLEWLLREKMIEKKMFYPLFELKDKRSKFDRIVDSFNGIASNRQFYVKKGMNDFVSQFIEYPNTNHDDLLDACSMALSNLNLFSMRDAQRMEARKRWERIMTSDDSTVRDRDVVHIEDYIMRSGSP